MAVHGDVALALSVVAVASNAKNEFNWNSWSKVEFKTMIRGSTLTDSFQLLLCKSSCSPFELWDFEI